jgi:hypothetical protein
LKELNKENKDFTELMEDSLCDEDKKFKKGQRLIPSHEFKMPYKMLNTMILWIYGEETNTHFQMEWILFSYTTVNTG